MPKQVWLKRIGAALVPATYDDQQFLAELKENIAIQFDCKMPRSNKHHNLFFAAIAQAQMNWPESHEFQPTSIDHLRAWLLCKAGYRHTETHQLESAISADLMASVIEKSLEQAGAKGFAVYKGSTVYVLTPKSISWSKLDQKEFNKISQGVDDVLKSEINMSLDDFKQEQAA